VTNTLAYFAFLIEPSRFYPRVGASLGWGLPLLTKVRQDLKGLPGTNALVPSVVVEEKRKVF
jgi:hypothetical protein